jgi:hypothetical protein
VTDIPDEMNTIPIPAEAYQAADEAIDKNVEWNGNQSYSRHGEVAIEAGAPHIDRAARIDELRRAIDLNDRRADQVSLDTESGGQLRVHFLGESDRLRARIVELEAPA